MVSLVLHIDQFDGGYNSARIENLNSTHSLEMWDMDGLDQVEFDERMVNNSHVIWH